MEDFNALFNPNVEVKDQTSKNTDEYSPSADKGTNGIYKAIIRFVPWWQDPKHGSIQEKWVAWLEDPLTQKGRPVDCPSSVGKPSPLQDMYWKLKKSDNVAMQSKAKIFSRRHTFASLIQVIKDDNNKDLEGKILVYRYGVKIWDKINSELRPMVGEKHDPFDILKGKAFALVITKVSGFNNYDQTKFLDERIPLCIPNEKGDLIPINKDTDKKMVFDFVKENSPDLSKYAFQEWDKETHDYVNQVISAVTGQSNVSQNYADISNKDVKKDAPSDITATDLNIDDINSENSSDDLPDLNLPDLDSPSDSGIGGNLDDIMNKL